MEMKKEIDSGKVGGPLREKGKRKKKTVKEARTEQKEGKDSGRIYGELRGKWKRTIVI